jgi:uncharacterized cofD-like protein
VNSLSRWLSPYQRYSLKKGPRIVVIGGGTGLSVLLRGLKEYTSNLTAIVSVTDDGGSSGKLRGEMGIIPPGDIRNCLVALADTEPAMEKLFSYRFKQCTELSGHNLGNLLIAAMTDLTGSFETAIDEVSKVLAIRGKVVPVSYDNLRLGAELEDGSVVMGESSISRSTQRIRRVFLDPDNCQPSQQALEAIAEADAIIFGPGSLYTSVIPNLLVPEISKAIKSSPAMKIYVCNVMTQAGETKDYTASDHLKALFAHSAEGIVDYVIANNQKVPPHYANKYAAEGAYLVKVDRKRIAQMGVGLIQASLIHESISIRHNSEKLAALIVPLITDKGMTGKKEAEKKTRLSRLLKRCWPVYRRLPQKIRKGG